MPDTSPATPPLAATGIKGLDDILGGGFAPNRLYLIEGDPGSGKTTLALQFLLEGAAAGERGLYVTLSETKEELDGGRPVPRLVARRPRRLRADPVRGEPPARRPDTGCSTRPRWS